MSDSNIYNRLYQEIGNAYGVCGLMGNIKAESAMRSNNLQNSGNSKLKMTDEEYTAAVDIGEYTKFATDSKGYGLCQWTSSGRKRALLNYARQLGTSIGDEDMQIFFMLNELSTSYKSVLKVLKSASSVKEASDIVVKKFERPANQSDGVLKSRAKYGQEFYDKFANQEESGMGIYTKGKAVQLSKNFKSTEFDCNGKGCCSETPIDPKLVEILQNVRDHFGVSVNLNCGYRCPVHNAQVSGASATSKHMEGIAADIVVKGVHPVRVARYIATIPGFAGRIGCYTYDDTGSGFVHVDVRGTNSKGIYTENNVNYDSVASFGVSVKKGSKGRIVKVVQRKLKTAGLYSGDINGSCDSGTEKAIVAWNAAAGRKDDKSWGPKCWNEAFPI